MYVRLTWLEKSLFENDLITKVEPESDYRCFLLESLILAQNERWRRGLGMQVEREFVPSSRKVRRRGGEWRKGEEHVGNLSQS